MEILGLGQRGEIGVRVLGVDRVRMLVLFQVVVVLLDMIHLVEFLLGKPLLVRADIRLLRLDSRRLTFAGFPLMRLESLVVLGFWLHGSPLGLLARPRDLRLAGEVPTEPGRS
jgi:hypothetical protein